MSEPNILPVLPDIPRPFWSIMIPTYNPKREFLKSALDSVLKQAPPSEEIQIELVDDASPCFDPQEFLEDLADPRVGFYRQAETRGLGGNWNTCIQQARGLWVHILHQDDFVLDGFYRILSSRLASRPEIGAAFTQLSIIDQRGKVVRRNRLARESSGILEDWPEHIFVNLKIQTAAIVVRRSVYEEVGGFDTSMKYALDWNMWKKIAVNYPIWFEAQLLACYREHKASVSSLLARSGRNMSEIRQSIEFGESILPAETAKEVTWRARLAYTGFGVDFAIKALRGGEALTVAWHQLREASRLTSWFEVARAAVRKAIQCLTGRT